MLRVKCTKCSKSHLSSGSVRAIMCSCGSLLDVRSLGKPTIITERLIESASRSRRLLNACKQRSRTGEGLGSSIDRFAKLASAHFKFSLAAELEQLLSECGCDRSIAIESLNSSSN